MADVRKHVRVFLASPGDVVEERKLAKSVVDEFNSLFSESYGYQVDLVGWEDTVSVFGRPQGTINADLAKCELFVGVIWKKWGTPPSVNGPYTSGFEEEFRLSLRRRAQSGAPEMSMFFKEISEDLLRDPGDQLKKVVAFKNELVDGKYILFETFSESREFEKKFLRCIATYVKRLADAENERLADESQSSKAAASDSLVTKSAGQSALSAEGAHFARAFLDLCESGHETEIADSDIARFRLLGALLRGGNNDIYQLGVHDSNLLYRYCDAASLGAAERSGLLRAGLASLDHENIPIWRWLASFGAKYPEALIELSFSDDPNVQRGSLNVMRLLECPIPIEFDRRNILEYWLAKERMAGSRISVIKYLTVCGLGQDVELLRAEFDLNDGQTNHLAAEAIVLISLRDGRASAVSALYQLRPTTVSKRVVTALFEDDSSSLSDELVLRGLTQPSGDVRYFAARIGFGRNLFLPNQADELLADDDRRIRYLAMKYLMGAGRVFAEKEAEELLKKPDRSLLAENSELLEEFKRLVLRSYSDQDLDARAKRENAFKYDANIAMVERKFTERGSELRSWIDDGFHGVFHRGLESLAKTFDGDQKFLSDVKLLEGYITKTNTRSALDVLYRFAGPSDLHRVRHALAEALVDPSVLDYEYLGKHGDWSDIKLVLELAQKTGGLSSLLLSVGSIKEEAVALCLFKLGRQRIYDLLKMEMADSIRVKIASLVPSSMLTGLQDGEIYDLLHVGSDAFRKVIALKCVAALPKKRAASILDSYVNAEGFRFYNVIFWLDLAQAFSRGVSTRAARLALEGF